MGGIEGLTAYIGLALAALPGVFLGTGRVFGLMLTFPLITRLELPLQVRNGLALARALPVVAGLVTGRAGPLPSGIALVGAGVLKEVALGAFLGFLLGVPFWAAQSAGDAIDVYRGASAQNLFDPVNAAEVSTLGGVLSLLSLALFVAAGGLQASIGLLYESYAVWPPLEALPRVEGALGAVGGALTEIARLGLVLAAPPLIVFAVVDLGFAFAGRSAKGFELGDLPNTAKNFAAALLAPVYFGFMALYLRDEMMRLLGALAPFLRR